MNPIKTKNKTTLLEIVQDLFNKSISEADLKEHFFSNKIGLDSLDLVYFYSEIKRRFQIEIPEQYILDGSFCSIENVLNILCSLEADNEENPCCVN